MTTVVATCRESRSTRTTTARTASKAGSIRFQTASTIHQHLNCRNDNVLHVMRQRVAVAVVVVTAIGEWGDGFDWAGINHAPGTIDVRRSRAGPIGMDHANTDPPRARRSVNPT